ncbi:MAG: T9SS type A sorting domain-containing protein [Sphingobacteriales bacterium]|nr:MAG: T9SS type A sorting domain-containing protein [Sphingobacteriales bacterium]
MKTITRLGTKLFKGINKILNPATVLLLVISFTQLSAQTNYYYRGSGNINAAASWTTNATGGAGSSPANFTTANQLFNLGNSSTGSFSLSPTASWTISGAGSQLIIPNGTTLTATSTISTPTLTIQNGGTVQSNAAITIGTAFNLNNGGTYIHNNTSNVSTTIFKGIETFGVTSNFRILLWQNSSTSITSNLTAAATTGGNNYYYGNLDINWPGNVNWNQGWGSTNIYLTAGNFSINPTFTGTFLFTSANAQPYVYVNGNYTMNASGGTMDFSTNSAANFPLMYVNGNITHSAGIITTSGANAYGSFSTFGSLSPTWTFSGGSRNYLSYVITAGKTVTLGSAFNLNDQPTTLNDLTINGTFHAGNYIISYAATGSSAAVVIAPTGTITTTNVNGLAGSTTTTIDPTNTVNTYLQSGSTVEYRANGGTQIITTPSNANFLYDATNSNLPNYENLTINGTGIKQITSNTTVNGTLTLSGGTAGSTNLLRVNNNTLTVASTGGISGGNAYNYIITGTGAGRLRINAVTSANYNTTKYFYIGTSSCYLPAAANPTATSDFTAGVFTGATTNGTSGGTAYTATQKKGLVDAVWNIDRNNDRIAISGTANITLNWDNCYSSLKGTDFAAAANGNIGIWRWVSGTNWSASSSNFSASNNNGGGGNYASTTANNTFNGPFIVAVLAGPLANNNLNVRAALINNDDVQVSWSLQNSTDIKDFDVERSYDKLNFIKIGKIRSTIQNNYSYTDKNPPGNLIYYRLALHTLTGGNSYSEIVSVTKKMTDKLRLYNNPVTDKLIFYHPPSLKAQYRVINTDGKMLMKGNIAANAVISTLNIQSLSKGMYLLQLINENEVTTQRFIKY